MQWDFSLPRFPNLASSGASKIKIIFSLRERHCSGFISHLLASAQIQISVLGDFRV